MPTYVWDEMRIEDLSAVNHIADTVHAAYPEDAAVFAERLQIYPYGCFVLKNADVLKGYAIAHPWRLGEAPKLNSLLHRIENPNMLYIHDIALMQDVRRIGLGRKIVQILQDLAQKEGYKKMGGIAVGDSFPFWARQGFSIHQGPNLESYGPDAAYMICG
jgi:GNAT superfamily N-acetyltransferase